VYAMNSSLRRLKKREETYFMWQPKARLPKIKIKEIDTRISI